MPLFAAFQVQQGHNSMVVTQRRVGHKPRKKKRICTKHKKVPGHICCLFQTTCESAGSHATHTQCIIYPLLITRPEPRRGGGLLACRSVASLTPRSQAAGWKRSKTFKSNLVRRRPQFNSSLANSALEKTQIRTRYRFRHHAV